MDAITQGTTQLLGLQFDTITLPETIEHLVARPHDAQFAYVVTPNADHIVRLRRIPRLGPVYRQAWLRILDSQVIALCADRLGLARPPVVTGADLTKTLLARLDGTTVAVIGMRPGTIAALAARYPKIHFLHHQPPMDLLHHPTGFDAA